MKKLYKLSKEEKEILGPFKKGEWKSVPDFEKKRIIESGIYDNPQKSNSK